MRDYVKILKTDLLSKSTMQKAQEFAQADNLGLLSTELADIDVAKEVSQIQKNLLTKHGQAVDETKKVNILGKRLAD